MLTSTQLINEVKNIARNHKTVYVYGSFGSLVTDALLQQKAKQFPKFYTASRMANLKKYVDKGYWGFDCVNLIKGVLWGWNGDKSKTYGGAKYASNGVPDTNADGMISMCKNVSTNFSTIEVGEVVWIKGHIGVYIGDGLVVECTPAWKNCVQITACGNIGKKSGYNTRTWVKHGKLPWVIYPATKKTYTGSFPTLPTKGYFKKGDTGTQVRYLQMFLNWYGGYGLSVDGSFGELTLAAVKKFQKAEGLAVDGYFGKKTLAKAKTIKK